MEPSRFGKSPKKRASIHSRKTKISLVKNSKKMSMMEGAHYSGEVVVNDFGNQNDQLGDISEGELEDEIAEVKDSENVKILKKVAFEQRFGEDLDFQKVEGLEIGGMGLNSFKKSFDKITEPVQKSEFVGKDMGRSRNSTRASSFEAWTFDSDEEDNYTTLNPYPFKTRSPSTFTTASTSSTQDFSHKCPTTLTSSVKKVEEAEKRKAKIKENLFCPVIDFRFQSDDEDSDEEEEDNDWLGTKIVEDRDPFKIFEHYVIPTQAKILKRSVIIPTILITRPSSPLPIIFNHQKIDHQYLHTYWESYFSSSLKLNQDEQNLKTMKFKGFRNN